MFRNLKKRVKNLSNSVHGRSGSRHGTDDGNNEVSDLEKYNTPARKYSAPAAPAPQFTSSPSTNTVSTVSSGDTGSGPSVPSGRPPSLPTGKPKRHNKNKKRNVLDIPLEELDVVSKIEHLAKFDVCVQAADALAAASGSHSSDLSKGKIDANSENSSILASENRVDASSGLPCTSILVSPDGYMLLIPPASEKRNDPSNAGKAIGSSKEEGKEEATNDGADKTEKLPEIDNKVDSETTKTDGLSENNSADDEDVASVEDEKPSDQAGPFSNLRLHAKEDYESAVYVGNDLDPTGDKVLNGFSAKGWSIPATTLALEQTEQSLNALAHFCEQMILSRKESAARTAFACDNLRRAAATIQHGKSSTTEISDSWVIIDPRAVDFEMAPNRTGPLLSEGSTLATALSAFEEYYIKESENEATRWRTASLQRGHILPKMHDAVDRLHERSSKRQLALQESSRRVHVLEERVRALQQLAESKWQAVYDAEQKVTLRQQQLLEERRQLRDKARLEKLKQDEAIRLQETTAVNKGDAALGATSKEIWDMVSSVVDPNADFGSFEPMDLPTAPLSAPRDKSFESTSFEEIQSTSSTNSGPADPLNKQNSTASIDVNIPVLSRDEIAAELGLPQLRAAARQADDAVRDTADNLLNVLSTLDTTRRSARIAAETCLLSAANAQAECLQTWIQLEKESLHERLGNLLMLEEKIESTFNVRADLDKYITVDKKERGGSSHLGDDDDGGVASALAVLSSHVDGLERDGSDGNDNTSNQDSPSDDDEPISQSSVDEAIEKLFEDNATYLSDSDSPAKASFAESVRLICKVAKERSRAKRSRICYGLNSKRSTNSKIQSQVQFDALCEVFDAILTGCNTEVEVGGVSNAKMCMMLSQTFYIDNPDTTDVSRKSRIYIRSRLVDHPIWAKDDFWDIALTQQISESLTHSGVMSNFERTNSQRLKSEYEKARKVRWYDLNQTERIEAASQVHAVVFAQLGALAHSMLELGCGLHRACTFVRRMSIRNQLPSSHRTMLLMHLMERQNEC